MFSLLVRNLFFTILQPGLVAGLIPFLILRNKVNNIFVQPLRLYHYMGTILFLIGLIIMLSCIIRFATKGQGTLSPADPTKRLVVTGLYRFSRNPMYIGVMLILIGETVFTQSASLLIYSLFIFLLFNIFILVHEEPRLKRVFGEEYTEYQQKARRWI
jgi:protein-S-isoprenylcysteine O-methyltransferase Ste14